ncbi:hypothetical protein DL95DRAFT_429735 [Leptodontidium sp. 2 PMI_412]|nr:hypothetical protein DL95DRAFT_429735 [Leptodontidium sp. 2 PMI_412]
MYWYWGTLLCLVLVVPGEAVVRLHCSQLVTERLDPLVSPGLTPSSHVHQIVGGNSFNATMSPTKDMPGESTCTSCQYVDDFSNYWTAVLYFRAQNGSYKRVPQLGNNQFEKANGGMTLYYQQDAIYDPLQKSKVTAFKPGFRMFIGSIYARTITSAAQFRQLTYTCMDTWTQRSPETAAFPTRKCKEGILTSLRFPTCWDGINLDSPNHMSHMSYPSTGTFESNASCPSTHPVRTAQVMFEVVWNTKVFNKEDWPNDGTSPWVWSFGDATGYANHADYVFGWKGDSLQRILDTPCRFNCEESGLKVQSVEEMNKCKLERSVKEDIDSWLPVLPGGFHAERILMAM